MQMANLPGNKRAGEVSFSINDTGYVGLGHTNSVELKDFWQFIPETNTWTQIADYGGGLRVGVSAIGYNGTGYVVGGRDDMGNDTKDFWKYNPTTNNWTQLANFGEGVSRGHALFAWNDTLFVGMGAVGTTPQQDCWKYSISTNSWSQSCNFQGGTLKNFAFTGVDINNDGNDELGYVGTGRDGGGIPRNFSGNLVIKNQSLLLTTKTLYLPSILLPILQ